MNTMGRYGGLVFLMSATAATVWGKLSDRWSSPHVRNRCLQDLDGDRLRGIGSRSHWWR